MDPSNTLPYSRHCDGLVWLCSWPALMLMLALFEVSAFDSHNSTLNEFLIPKKNYRRNWPFLATSWIHTMCSIEEPVLLGMLYRIHFLKHLKSKIFVTNPWYPGLKLLRSRLSRSAQSARRHLPSLYFDTLHFASAFLIFLPACFTLY